MATKKQKRARALAKREAFLEDLRRSGLEAQRKGHEEEARRKKAKNDAKVQGLLDGSDSMSVVFSGGKS